MSPTAKVVCWVLFGLGTAFTAVLWLLGVASEVQRERDIEARRLRGWRE